MKWQNTKEKPPEDFSKSYHYTRFGDSGKSCFGKLFKTVEGMIVDNRGNNVLEYLDEQGDAIRPDLEQRAKEWVKQHESWVPDEQSEGAMFNAYLAGATNHPQPGIVDQLRKDNPYTTDDIDSEIGWDNCCDKLESILKEQGGEEKDVTCVFCEMPCEPAPTKRGWSSVRFGKGLHFDCAGKVVDQGNIIGMKELEELGKDPTA